MKHPVFLSLMILFVLFGFLGTAFSQGNLADKPSDAFRSIDQDFREGNITLDQKVLYKLYASKNAHKLPKAYQIEGKSILKCGTPAISDFHHHKAELLQSTITEAESLLGSSNIQAQETYQSPSGNFTIHYDTSGDHAVPPADSDGDNVPDYVEEVAAAADSSYQHEVQNLGYTDPLVTSGHIDVYILNLEVIYGQSDGRSIQIENDFAEGFPPNDDPEGNQIGAIKVTIAHELKHVIQYSASQWQGEVFYWLEMDATLMEEVVYDNVNDYYNYIRSDESIFKKPEESFYPGTYYHVSWAIYFEEKYGSQFWVDVWEIIKDNPTIAMVDAITQNLGGTEAFDRAYTESQLWHYASGPDNAVPDFGFEESEYYPAPDVTTEGNLFDKNFTIPRSSPLDSPRGFSAKYFNVSLQNDLTGELRLEAASQGPKNGVGVIAYFNDGSAESLVFSLSEDEPTFKRSNLNWDNINRLGLVLSNSSTSSSNNAPIFVSLGTNEFDNTLSQNYPNPFNPSTKIRFTLEEDSHVKLKVFDSVGRLVKTLIDEELTAGLYEPTFDGSGLASGVYLYQLVTDRQQIVEKMTLIK